MSQRNKKLRCAFCKGTGVDPFALLSERSACQVCCGRGEVEVGKPEMLCVFCRGGGVYPGKRVTCTVCAGKGAVTAPQGALGRCPECKGGGAAADSGLPCLACGGKGVVPLRPERDGA